MIVELLKKLIVKKYYKEKHYDKQRKIYFDGYKQGKQDAYQKQKKNEED